jgi:hypothetical protein
MAVVAAGDLDQVAATLDLHIVGFLSERGEGQRGSRDSEQQFHQGPFLIFSRIGFIGEPTNPNRR